MQKPKLLPSGRYLARFNYNGKRYSAGTFDTIRKAEAAARKLHTGLEAQAKNPKAHASAGTITFEEYAAKVLTRRSNEKSLAPRSVTNYEAMLRLHINPTLGAMKLVEIRKVHLKDWWSTMPVAPIRKNAYRLVGMILSSAADDDEIEVNPAYKAIRKAGEELSKPRPYLSPEMFAQLHSALSRDMQAFAMMTLGGSLRLGEALGLNRRDLDLKTGVLTVDKQYANTPGGWAMTDPKNGGKRKVKLPAEALDAMRDYIRRHPAIGIPAPMFVNRDGFRLSRGAVYREWNRARHDVGMPWLHVHDLRHSSLTVFAQGGATLADLMARAGHKDPRTTMTYLHPDPERESHLADRFSEEMFKRPSAGDGTGTGNR